MVGKEEEQMAGNLQGMKEVTNLHLAFIESMALKCIIELGITDIIHSHGSPMSLNQIATKIDSESLNLSYLSRIMRLLVHKKVFAATTTTGDDQLRETLYGLTHFSKLLLHDCDMTMVPIVMMNTHPRLVDPWHHISASVKNSESAIKKACGSTIWEILSSDPNMNNIFNAGVESTTKFSTKAVLSSYKDGFAGIETLVDVGGGVGYLLSEIIKAYQPLIRGINLDLQYVVENAPSYPGITHVGGDMFESIPYADGIIMKSVLHNWNDEKCEKILRNCKRALSKSITERKLVLVEMVENEGVEEGSLDETTMKLDLLMMVYCIGGKERTRVEWINLLEGAGFSRINFIKMPTIQYIIEAYAT